MLGVTGNDACGMRWGCEEIKLGKQKAKNKAERELWRERSDRHFALHAENRKKWEDSRVAGRDPEADFRVKHTDGIDCNNLAIPILHRYLEVVGAGG